MKGSWQSLVAEPRVTYCFAATLDFKCLQLVYSSHLLPETRYNAAANAGGENRKARNRAGFV
jgi:hypothetical protein